MKEAEAEATTQSISKWSNLQILNQREIQYTYGISNLPVKSGTNQSWWLEPTQSKQNQSNPVAMVKLSIQDKWIMLLVESGTNTLDRLNQHERTKLTSCRLA